MPCTNPSDVPGEGHLHNSLRTCISADSIPFNVVRRETLQVRRKQYWSWLFRGGHLPIASTISVRRLPSNSLQVTTPLCANIVSPYACLLRSAGLTPKNRRIECFVITADTKVSLAVDWHSKMLLRSGYQAGRQNDRKRSRTTCSGYVLL